MRERLNPRIPFRVRIHGGDSGVSARATHHDVQKDTLMTNEKGLFAQADTRIVRVSTIERKKMSTKTSFKRIALVAALSLGLGALTSVSANAAPGTGDITPTVGTLLGTAGTDTTVSGVVGGQVAFTYTIAAAGTRYITSDANSTIVSAAASAGNTAVATDGSSIKNGVTATLAGDDTDVLTVTLGSDKAGTSVVTIKTIDGATGVSTSVAKLTITWGSVPGLSATNSKVVIEKATNDTSVATSDSSDVLLSQTTGNGDDQVSIWVTLKDSNDAAFNGQKLTVTLDGPGLIQVEQNQNGIVGAMTNRIYADSTANAGNTWQIGVAPDGTAGRLNVTVSVGTTVLGVKSMTFYGAAAKYTATSTLIATANGSATTDAVNVCAVDKNGTAVPGATIHAVSGDATVASVEASDTTASSAVAEDVDTGSAGTALVPTAYQSAKALGCAGFTVTGVSQTIKDSVVLTFRDAALAADATFSTTLTQLVGSTTASATTVAFDKASYTTGAKAVITLTFKDSVGRLVGAGAGAGTLDAALTSSAALQGAALFATDNNLKQGTVTADVYVPWVAGTVSVSGKTGQGAGLATAGKGVSITASAAVTAAADSTSAQLASLIKKINALQKLIAKIQKRLGVK